MATAFWITLQSTISYVFMHGLFEASGGIIRSDERGATGKGLDPRPIL